MPIGKRRQKKRCTNTAVGDIRPADGLNRGHVEEALRLTRPPELPRRGRSTAPRAPRSLSHMEGTVKMLIGCAQRAGMGGIRAVSESVRRVLRRAKRSGLSLEAAVSVAIDTAAESAELLTIEPREAAAVAGFAARDVSRSENDGVRAAVDARIVEAVCETPEISDDPESAPASPPTNPEAERPLRVLRIEAALAVRESADEILDAPPPGTDARAIGEMVIAAADEGRSPAGAIRDVANAVVRIRAHRGRDIQGSARKMVVGTMSVAARLDMKAADVGALAAHYCVDAAYALGRHATHAVHESLTQPMPSTSR